MRFALSPICLVPLAALLSACAAVPGAAIDAQAPTATGAMAWAQQVQYLPIEPIYSATYSQDGRTEHLWSSLDKTKIRDMLPNQSSETVIKKFEGQSKVAYLVVDTTVEGSRYEVLMEWMKYRLEPITSGSETSYGKVGVGMRVKANIKALKGGVNLNGIVGLAAAVKANQIEGGIKVDLIGIDSSGVSALLPLGVSLDESSIQQALQTLAQVQTKVYDANVLLTPHIVAVRNSPAAQTDADPAEKARSLVKKPGS